MKQQLGSIIHQLTKLFAKRMEVSTAQTEECVKRSLTTQHHLRDWLGNAAHEVISLGQNCNTAWYIKAAGLKRASYPFDWIYTTPAIITHILDDDFAQLLDRDLIIPHGMDAGHKVYHETLFGHRNPVRSDADYAYYQRCVARWRERMTRQEPIVFVTTVLNEPDKRPRFKAGFTKQIQAPGHQTIADFEGMMQRLKHINPHCRFLFIEQYTEGAFQLDIMHQREDALWIRFCALGRNTGVRYLTEVDEQVMLSMFAALAAEPEKTTAA